MDAEKLEEYGEEISIVIGLLDKWGSDSRFIWFHEISRLTAIDRGLLRNILNYLKKTKEVRETRGQNKRIFFALNKHYKSCYDAEIKLRGKSQIASSDEHSKAKGLSRTQKSIERTRKRIEKQQKRREVKLFSRAKYKRKVQK